MKQRKEEGGGTADENNYFKSFCIGLLRVECFFFFFFWRGNNLCGLALLIGEWGIGIGTVEQMQNKTRKDRRCLCVSMCACVNIRARGIGFGVSVEALLSSLRRRLLSSPLVAALMRSFTGGEKRETRRGSLLEKGGVDEIITQLSWSLSRPRAAPSMCVCVHMYAMCVFLH